MGKRRWDTDSFRKKIDDITLNEYEVCGMYISSNVKIKIKHKLCFFEWDIAPSTFLAGTRCPKCNGGVRKKDTAYFKNEIFALVGDEYTVLSEYKTTHTKVKFKHKICEGTFHICPSDFLNGQRCIHCSKLNKLLKFEEEFKVKLFNLVGEEYSYIGDYKSSKDKAKLKHNVCGYEWSMTPQLFYFGRRCPLCNGRSNFKDTDFFKKEMKKYGGEDYELIGEYSNSKEKVKIKHSCGYEWNVLPNNFLNGQRCPNCFSGIKNKNTEIFKNEVFKLTGDDYTVLEEYQLSNIKIKIRHNICGCEFDINPARFSFGSRCPKCFSKITKRDTEYFKNEIFELCGSEYELQSEYKTVKAKVKIKHVSCSFEYMVSPEKFLLGRRCPTCSSSRGEEKIKDFLTINNINFIKEYTFSDCRNKNKLPFDFAIFDQFENLKTLIEFDGEQHERPIEFFGGEKKFKALVKRDAIKTNYCIVNNIPLIRISHRDYEHIEEILTFALIELNFNIAI